MTDLREAAQMALDALNNSSPKNFLIEKAISQGGDSVEIIRSILKQHTDITEALRAALAQPEQESAYGYASSLAAAIWEKHYKGESPHWKVNDSLLGVLTQIDNMTTGLAKAQPEQEPFEYWNAVEGWVKIDEVRQHFDTAGCGTIYKTAGEGRVPLYTAPQQEWVGLTDEEIGYIADDEGYGYMDVARAIQAKLKEKNGF